MDKITAFVTTRILNFKTFDGITYGIIGAVLIAVGLTDIVPFVAGLSEDVLTFIGSILIPVGLGFLVAAIWKTYSK